MPWRRAYATRAANLRKQVNVNDITVTCVCGREMRALATQGPGHYRCANCRSRIHVTIPVIDPDPNRCGITIESRRCTGRRILDLDICENHLNNILVEVLADPDYRKSIMERLSEKEVAQSIREAQDQHILERRRSFERAQAMRPDCPVVYYVKLAEDNIKIGTTVFLSQRMAGLRIRDKTQVLAAEPGGHKLERQRHQQFAHLRYDPYREDFRPDEDLMAHIAAVRSQHGPPYELAARMLDEARSEAQVRLVAKGW